MFEANTNTAFPRGIKFVQIVQPAVECEQNTHCRYNSLCSATAVLHAQTQINTCKHKPGLVVLMLSIMMRHLLT